MNDIIYKHNLFKSVMLARLEKAICLSNDLGHMFGSVTFGRRPSMVRVHLIYRPEWERVTASNKSLQTDSSNI